MEVTKINNPAWEFADFHQRSVEVGLNWENEVPDLQEILPPPNHQLHPQLTIGPGAPHAGPYDHEMADSYSQHSWTEKTTYTLAEATNPNEILSTWMVVPSAGAKTGKSPDSDNGPIIPNTLFPIHFKSQDFANGAEVVGNAFEFDVPALDSKLNPPFNVDGHSHFPLFTGRNVSGEAVMSGQHERRMTMVDTSGAGYSFSIKLNIQ